MKIQCFLRKTLVFLSIVSYQNYNSPERLIASYALIVSAIFRLAPTSARLQVNINKINSAIPAVKELLDIIQKYNIHCAIESTYKTYQSFKDSIELKGINFSYTDKPVLKNINLKIKKGEFIGITGVSGAGKTTLADIIAGLYKPISGEILIDGKRIFNDLKISYIPQEFTIISETIRENVAFGNNNIDDEKVIDALKKAQLYDHIVNNYSKGIYEAPFTDSDGLSMGQKQRLAIARALYQDSDILIIDEGTSSLDLKTENKICKVLENLKGKKTIIAIAHRLSTIKLADRIIFIKNGHIDGDGPFEQLNTMNHDFKELVKFASLQNGA